MECTVFVPHRKIYVLFFMSSMYCSKSEMGHIFHCCHQVILLGIVSSLGRSSLFLITQRSEHWSLFGKRGAVIWSSRFQNISQGGYEVTTQSPVVFLLIECWPLLHLPNSSEKICFKHHTLLCVCMHTCKHTHILWSNMSVRKDWSLKSQGGRETFSNHQIIYASFLLKLLKLSLDIYERLSKGPSHGIKVRESSSPLYKILE